MTSISPEAGEMPAESAGYTPDERKRLGLDIDAGKLKDALRELSHAFVEGRQGSYGMRIPAEPYRDGDLICGAAYRLICQMEESLTAAQADLAECQRTVQNVSADLSAANSSLTTAQAENDSLQSACLLWREQFDSKDAALQSARLSLTAAQAEIEELRYTRRWNIAQVGDVLEVCRGDHDKSAGCVPERYVRESALTAREQLLERAARQFRQGNDVTSTSMLAEEILKASKGAA